MAEETLTTAQSHGHGHGEHPPHLAHHFESPGQQFDACKFGMWIFLCTEVLMFSGLFCAYAVYRANHPEIFLYAHKYLDTNLGAINTAVLICSSFTMAWAVRAAQKGQQGLLIGLLALTLLGGFGFLGIKYIEYEHKFHKGLLPGAQYNPTVTPGDHGNGDKHAEMGDHELITSEHDAGNAHTAPPGAAPARHDEEPAVAPTGVKPTEQTGLEKTTLPQAAPPPAGRSMEHDHAHEHGMTGRPNNVHLFFGIYFAMTGLHGIHVLAGMAFIAWVLKRSIAGEFGPEYFTPVDLVGLYWHLVDLIWIFLFPLLYLIH